MTKKQPELSVLERDLRFFPIKNPSPRKLSHDQIDAFNVNGFLMPFRSYAPEEADRLRTKFDSIISKFLSAGKDSYSIENYHDKFATLYEVAVNPAILDIVEDLIGPNIVCWSTQIFAKMPNDKRSILWHQDCSYWPLTPSKTVAVWLAIDDSDRKNGCLQYIPGTHLHGYLPWHESDPAEMNVLSQAISDVEQYGTAFDVELRAGEASIHSDLLVHGSMPNRSQRRRCGISIRYCPPDVRAFQGMNEKSIVCRGVDSSGHWANIPKPSNDTYSITSAERSGH